MLNEGFVKRNNHPDGELSIYNYTQTTQFSKNWNEVTLHCRGLILDENMNIVARPFPKFFNLGEQENQIIPDENFEVFEKMDGSLGILYWHKDIPKIATRGSFTSDQALFASNLLHEKYSHTFDKLNRNYTYLFEIIYPENRIVINYGDLQDLILLAIIDNSSAKDIPLENIGFPIVKKYDGINDIVNLKLLEEDNKEGFVIKFESGIRYKVKFNEYLRIHRIVTQISSINIWEYLASGQSFDELLERVPDEFYSWVKTVVDRLKSQFNEILEQSKKDFKVLENRKDTALYFTKCKYPQVLFAMLDNKNYNSIIWRMLRPNFEQPFKNKEEE